MTDEAIFALLPDASERFVGRMADGPWPDRGARHLDWTPREITTHLATVVDYFDAMLDGGSPVPGLAALANTNAQGLQARVDTPWADVVDEVREGTSRVAAALAEMSPDRRLDWHGGIEIDRLTAAGIFGGEVLVHEWDLERTLGQPTSLTADDARIVLAAVRRAMPHVLDDHTGNDRRLHLRIRVRGGERFDIRVADGAMTVTAPTGRPDCQVSVDPVAFFLLAYKRRTTPRVIATLGSVAWGRRPWQAISLPRLLDVP